MIKYFLLFFCFSALASLVMEQFPVAIKFERDKYTFTKPQTFGTRGLMLLLKDKSGYHNFSLASAGFSPSKKNFISECNKTHQAYTKMGGTVTPLQIDMKSSFPKCRFERHDKASIDMVEITYDHTNFRSYIFSGVLLIKKNSDIDKYKTEFKKLAGGITYNIKG